MRQHICTSEWPPRRQCQGNYAGQLRLRGPSSADVMPRPRKTANPIRYFHSSAEGIRLVGMIYGRFPLSLRNDRDLLFERGIGLLRETLRLWPNRFGPLFAVDIRRQRVNRMTIVSAV